MVLPREATLQSLPPIYPHDLLPLIRKQLEESGRKILALDDDPTGTQTVYNVPVLTEWSVESLAAELRAPAPVAYVLTNSRSLPRESAAVLMHEIAANLKAAQAQVPRPVAVISRSDSTLRGHFAAEIDALRAGLGVQPDGIVVAPFFLEGGRYTIDDVHYVAEGDRLIPAAETEFARDAYFGYTQSNLREWIAEKYGGEAPGGILSFSLSDLRSQGPDSVAARLRTISGGQFIVVNAADYRDLEVFVAGLMQAEKAGQRFLARTAASYVRVSAGLPPRGLLTQAEVVTANNKGAGLVVAGSYIQKSTAQIRAACTLPGVQAVEIHVNRLLDDEQRPAEIQRTVDEIAGHLSAGCDTVTYTSRDLVAGATREKSLEIGQVVSAALVEMVRRLPVRPGWLIAKGGITSSDVATKALGIRRAMVLGQILPGVPVWWAGDESRWPGMPYVVFPGNVGDETAIARVMTTLRGHEPA
jgi:uncharacterized protein YgbK (DUF1537 family)